MSEMSQERRRKKNAARKRSRLKRAQLRALPPAVGLSRDQYARLVGADANYDTYADAFIAGAKRAGRRWEFPLEPVGGASFPSPKPHRKGMPLTRK